MERIICAATWYKDLPTAHVVGYNDVKQGVVLCGHRHGQIIAQLVALTGKREATNAEDGCGEFEQGFLTSTGRFVNRQEAAKIWVDGGNKLKYSTIFLFSEDLY